MDTNDSDKIRASTEKIEALDAEIAELCAHLDAATYRLLVRVREFDKLEAYAPLGFVSTARWLNFRVGLDLGAAREKVRVALALESLPVLAAACERGEVSYSKVRALTRIATAENETELLELAQASTAAHVERLVRACRKVGRSEVVKQEAERGISFHFDSDGMLTIHGRLLADEGALLVKAIEAHMSANQLNANQVSPNQNRTDRANPSDVSAEARRADALMDLVAAAGGTAEAVELTVHVDVDAPVLGAAESSARAQIEGVGVCQETARRLACDGAVVIIQHGARGQVLDVGRKTRRISAPLRRALRARDGGCSFPSCTHRRVECHHVRHWADGGDTALSNVTCLCAMHHRFVHEHGYAVEVADDGAFVFRDPSGRVLPPCGKPTSIPGDVMATVRAKHAVLGLAIGADSQGLWDGHPFDYGLAVSNLARFNA